MKSEIFLFATYKGQSSGLNRGARQSTIGTGNHWDCRGQFMRRERLGADGMRGTVWE